MAEPKFKYVMIHHSLSKDCETRNWTALRSYHMSWRFNGVSITEEYARKLIKKGVSGVLKPWSDIGYHIGCEYVLGEGYTIQNGRAFTMGGAHCLEGGMNMLSIGFCYVGNFDINPPNEEQLIVGGKKIMEIAAKLGLGSDPMSFIKYHHEFAEYKSCPGKLFPTKEEFCELISQKEEVSAISDIVA